MAFTALNNQPASQLPPQLPVPKPVVPITHPHEIDTAFANNLELRKRVHAAIGTLDYKTPYAKLP